MATFEALIKGDIREAVESALSQGFEVTGIVGANERETMLSVEGGEREIVEWFTRESSFDAPFPAGALLFYTEKPSADPIGRG